VGEQPAGRSAVTARRIEGAPVRYPFRFVVAGDSGAWPDPTADAIREGPGRPEERGALFHAVELELSADGRLAGRVLQPFDGSDADVAALRFGGRL
jgi:hypothetical protein